MFRQALVEPELIHRLFLGKSHRGFIQFFRYVFVGSFTSVVNIGLLYLLTSKGHIYYLASAPIAFLVSIIASYLLSIWWVFTSSGKVKTELFFFILIGLSSLGLSELIIWVSVSDFKIFYLLGQVIAIVILIVWNFSLRRLLFDRLRKIV